MSSLVIDDMSKLEEEKKGALAVWIIKTLTKFNNKEEALGYFLGYLGGQIQNNLVDMKPDLVVKYKEALTLAKDHLQSVSQDIRAVDREFRENFFVTEEDTLHDISLCNMQVWAEHMHPNIKKCKPTRRGSQEVEWLTFKTEHLKRKHNDDLSIIDETEEVQEKSPPSNQSANSKSEGNKGGKRTSKTKHLSLEPDPGPSTSNGKNFFDNEDEDNSVFLDRPSSAKKAKVDDNGGARRSLSLSKKKDERSENKKNVENKKNKESQRSRESEKKASKHTPSRRNYTSTRKRDSETKKKESNKYKKQSVANDEQNVTSKDCSPSHLDSEPIVEREQNVCESTPVSVVNDELQCEKGEDDKAKNTEASHDESLPSLLDSQPIVQLEQNVGECTPTSVVANDELQCEKGEDDKGKNTEASHDDVQHVTQESETEISQTPKSSDIEMVDLSREEVSVGFSPFVNDTNEENNIANNQIEEEESNNSQNQVSEERDESHVAENTRGIETKSLEAILPENMLFMKPYLDLYVKQRFEDMERERALNQKSKKSTMKEKSTGKKKDKKRESVHTITPPIEKNQEVESLSTDESTTPPAPSTNDSLFGNHEAEHSNANPEVEASNYNPTTQSALDIEECVNMSEATCDVPEEDCNTDDIVNQVGSGQAGFKIVKTLTKYVKKFKVHAHEYHVNISKPSNTDNPHEFYSDVIDSLCNTLKENAKPTDKIGFVLKNSSGNCKPLALSYRYVSQFAPEAFWAMIFNASQSNADFLLSGHLTMQCNIIHMPVGKGRPTRKLQSIEDYSKNTRSLIDIPNKDTLCFARALHVAVRLANKKPNLRVLLADDEYMTREARLLCQQADCNLENGAGPEEWPLFQSILPSNMQLNVYDEITCRNPLFSGVADRSTGPIKRLNLFLKDGHYYVIKSMTGFLSIDYYCYECHTGFANAQNHKCKSKCNSCAAAPPCERGNEYLKCDICKRHFTSQTCLDNHKLKLVSNTKSTCDLFKACETCHKVYKVTKRRDHVCNEVFCKTCKLFVVPTEHKCYMKPDKKKCPPSDSRYLYVYWDVESDISVPIDEQNPELGNRHEVNLICAHMQCNLCRDNPAYEKQCPAHGLRDEVFLNNPVKDFFTFLLKPRKEFCKIILLAHCGGSYDNYFILDYVLNNLKVKPKIIQRESKIISLDIMQLRFLDSYNFISLPLADCPKALGLKETKGYFAYLFNTKANLNHVGAWPPVEDFDPDSMSTKKRDEFLKWYEEEKNKNPIYNHKETLIKYCKQDVLCLKAVCNEFQELMKKLGNINCFTECLTLAGCCSLIFRRNFLKPDTLGVLPLHNYRLADQASKIGIQWLLVEEKERGIVIEHSGRGRERRLPCGLLVDGYHKDKRTNEETLFFFDGCVYHGCDEHGWDSNYSIYNMPGDTMGLRNERTRAIRESLREQGYTVVEVKECKFRERLKNDKKLQTFLDRKKNYFKEKIDPREVLAGGRTELFCHYYECADGEKIQHKDYVSLYAWVLKYCKIPLGHPVIYLDNFPDLQKTDGIARVKILPPSDLLIPVLPTHCHGKLMFVLCRTCCELLHQGYCPHTDVNDRALIGSWVIDEILLALKEGYKILEIYEVWKYEVTDPNKPAENVFTPYIQTFLKYKVEKSGFGNLETEEEIQRYIEEFLEREGIILDRENIEYNSGMRFIAKTLLVSLWGRFALNILRSMTDIINKPEDLYKLLTNPNFDIKCLTCVGEENIVCNYEIFSELAHPDPTVNCVLASYVTCFGRMKLYSQMKNMGENLLYVDTDSYFTIARCPEDELPTGPHLGELQDETEKFGKNCSINCFVAASAKNYAYRVVNAQNELVTTCMKVKGISLNYRASEVVNFDTLKSIVVDNADPVYVPNPRKLRRTKDFKITSTSESKIYRAENLKRWRLPGQYFNLPYGFKRP